MLALTRDSSVPKTEWRLEGGDDALREVGRLVHALDVFAQNHELVAAQTRDGVGLAHRGSDASRRLDQELVADRVAERVVHRLEAVEVDEEHGEHALPTAHAGECLLEPVGEHHPVRQAGERVVQHLV